MLKILVPALVTIVAAAMLDQTIKVESTSSHSLIQRLSNLQVKREKYKEYYKVSEKKSHRKKRIIHRKKYEPRDQYSSCNSCMDKELEIKILDAGLNPKLFEVWFAKGTPQAIYFRENGENVVLKGSTPKGTKAGEKKILFLSNEESITKIKEQRNKEFNEAEEIEQEKEEQVSYERLPHNSFALAKFSPGLRDNKSDRIKPPENFSFSLQGPDHTFDFIDPVNDLETLLLLRERTISLGHGGEIIIKLTRDGIIKDERGPDFVIYENPFRFGEGLIYQEFAKVGVSVDGVTYSWFNCDPVQGDINGCAGVVLTEDGGDMLDLAAVKIDEVKYIKIVDTGLNMSDFGENTEGFDLDSLSITHAYKKIIEEPTTEDEDETDYHNTAE